MTVPRRNRGKSQIRQGHLRPFTHKNVRSPNNGTRILRVIHGPVPLFQAAAFLWHTMHFFDVGAAVSGFFFATSS
jgi:hypothetical protein